MKKLWHNCKGMVTVMVTLLLIPSLLITGTAVDIARIYTVKSLLQDANQLAANSTLTEYDALLQDLYGLYGIMEQDEVLAGMIDEYIQAAVLSEDGRRTGLGTFQIFYGSELKSGGVQRAEGQNLGNTEVLRRQIEEYAKFRVPVVLVDELWDRLESFEKVQKDADVIEQKMDLDDQLEKLTKSYKKIYEKIKEVDRFDAELDKAYAAMNDTIREINKQLDTMEDVRRQYTEYATNPARNNEDASPEERAHWEEYKEDYKTRYDGLKANIRSLIQGGTIKSWWVEGTWEDQENWDWDPGYFRDSEWRKDGLLDQMDWIDDLRKGAAKSMDQLVTLCEKADKERSSLAKKLSDIEKTLDTPGACSDGLKKSLKEPKAENGGRSALDVYRDMLKYEVTPMGRAQRGNNTPVLEEIKEQLENPLYGDWKNADGATMQFLALQELKTVGGFEIDLLVHNKTAANPKPDPLGRIASVGPSLCVYPQPGGYKLFQDSTFNSTKNPEFYALLEQMFGNPDNEVKKKNAKAAATKIFEEAQSLFNGMLKYEPEGAWNYAGGSAGAPGAAEGFGQGDGWKDEDAGKNATKDALKGDLVNRLGSIADKTANHLLLLGYDSEMFSCYITNKGKEQGKTSMAGIPFGIDVNYFYQSELEYLYGGDYDAVKNLKSVASMILLVRFVFNYIASFSITEVNELVRAVKEALSGLVGPFAFLIGELVRVGMALGESAVDVGRLRDGHTVKLYKNDETWRFSISGLVSAMSSGAVDSVRRGEKNTSALDDEDAFSYRDYLRVFLLLQSDAVLAQRTQRLIELNLTNKKNGIGGKGDRKAREAAMSNTELVDLSKAATGFSITTTAELRMLFLSLPVAQNGMGGETPPGSVSISVTDHRGY